MERRDRGTHKWNHLCRPGPSWGLTIGAQEAFKLGQKSNGIELPQKAIIVQAVPQLDDKAADEGCQLWGGTGTVCRTGVLTEAEASTCPGPFVSITMGTSAASLTPQGRARGWDHSNQRLWIGC